MDSCSRDAVLDAFLSSHGDSYAIDTPRIQHGLTTFLIRSFDGDALQFSFPLVIRRDLISETVLDPSGADGAACTVIERIKEQAESVPTLGPLRRIRLFDHRDTGISRPVPGSRNELPDLARSFHGS